LLIFFLFCSTAINREIWVDHDRLLVIRQVM
jgi:hypothetical protein